MKENEKKGSTIRVVHLRECPLCRSLNSAKNPPSDPIVATMRKCPLREVLLYLKRCISGRLLLFIKTTKFYSDLTSHHPIMSLWCSTVWKQVTYRSFVEIKILPMSSDRENLDFSRTNGVLGRMRN